MTTIYVNSSTGIDTNDGSHDNPLKTIEHASSLIQPNDTLYLFNGTYTMGSAFFNTWPSMFNSGAITIEGEDSNTVIINGNQTCNSISIGANPIGGVDDLTGAKTAGYVTQQTGASNLIFKHCTFKENVCGIYNGGILNFYNCIFDSETSSGIYNEKVYSDTRLRPSQIVAVNCIFSNNTIGIENHGHLRVFGCTFNNNQQAILNDGDALLYNNTYVTSTDILSGCTENSDKGVDTLEYNLSLLYKNLKKNLIQKGISVTDDMKLTTLVNKIMNIKLATKLTATFDNGVVTATLIDSNNNPVPNAKIELIDNSNTNCGYSNTNNDGVATITPTDYSAFHVVFNGNDSYYSSKTLENINYRFADIYVSTSGSDSNNGLTQDTAVATLSKAIELVSTNGVIGILNGTHTLTSDVTISKDCTIKGQSENGVIINEGNNEYSTIYNGTGTLTVSNCTFTTSSDGGIVNYSTGTVSATNCTFTSHEYGLSNVKNGTVTATNCTFISNSGGIVNHSTGTVFATNCTFISNDEGGVESYGVGTLTVTNCTFTSNGSYDVANIEIGTTILHCNTYTSGTAKLAGCTEGSCPATLTTTLTSSKTTMSTSDTATLTATVLDNTTAISGITVTFKEGTTTLGTGITNSSGVATYSYTPSSAGSKVITATTTATSIYPSSTSSSVTITVVAAYIYVSTTGNDANNGLTQDTAVATLSKAVELVASDGTIEILNGTYTLTSNVIISKACILKGQSESGVIINGNNKQYYIQYDGTGTLTVTNCTFISNKYGIYNMSTVTASNCTFNSNADGISNMGTGTVTASNCTFISNNTGLYNGSTSTVTASNCTFTSNSLTDVINNNIGTVNLHCNTYTSGTAKLIDCTEGSCP